MWISCSLLFKDIQCGFFPDHYSIVFVSRLTVMTISSLCLRKARAIHSPGDRLDSVIEVTLLSSKKNSLIQKGVLPKKATNLWVYDSNLDKPCLYLLPKTHKPNNPGRLIISGCSCPVFHLSKFSDSIVQLLVTEQPSFVNHTLSIFESTRLLTGQPCHLFLLNMCFSYTY